MKTKCSRILTGRVVEVGIGNRVRSEAGISARNATSLTQERSSTTFFSSSVAPFLTTWFRSRCFVSHYPPPFGSHRGLKALLSTHLSHLVNISDILVVLPSQRGNLPRICSNAKPSAILPVSRVAPATAFAAAFGYCGSHHR